MESVRDELPGRIERVRTIIGDHDLAGAVIYGDAGSSGYVRYLTNYAPFFGPVIFVLTPDGGSRLLVIFDWEIPRARTVSGLDDIEAGQDMAALLAGALDSLDLQDSRPLGLVGLDIIPHPTYEALTADRRGIVDISGELRELRLIKSPLEQEMLRKAVAATDAALQQIPVRVQAGMTEIEVAAIIDFEMRKAGAEGFAFPSGVGSGENTERPVNLPSQRRLQHGDLVMVDIGAVWEGYQADITRTFVVGEPNARQRRLYEIVRRTLVATLSMARPGISAAELHRNATSMLAEHDLAQYFTHRVGHGIGLETSLEPIDLRRDEMELRPGMTFCVEPGVYIPGFGGIKIEDDVIVTEGEPEIISHASRELLSL